MMTYSTSDIHFQDNLNVFKTHCHKQKCQLLHCNLSDQMKVLICVPVRPMEQKLRSILLVLSFENFKDFVLCMISNITISIHSLNAIRSDGIFC